MSVNRHSLRLALAWLGYLGCCASSVMAEDELKVQLTITSKLPARNVPFDPVIDFSELITQAKLKGVLDPNSISLVNAANGKKVPVVVTEDFSYGDRGRLEWVIEQPEHLKYEISFRVVAARPPRTPAAYTPPIGNGDLLRYNAGVPRPIGLPYLSRLVDLTGDGKADLVGCWNYAHRPGSPWDGIVCYPRTGDESRWEFGDLVRVRYQAAESPQFRHFSSIYMYVDIADLNRDGLPDIVYSPMQGDRLYFYLNTGKRDGGGMPVFAEAGGILRSKGAWEACRAVDLNGDRAIDLVVGDRYLRNTNAAGWPITPAEPVSLGAGLRAGFLDLDDDGLLDSVCLLPSEKPGPAHPARPAWRRNLGGDPPQFGPAQPLADVDVFWCSDLAAVNDSGKAGILVQHDVFQQVSFFEKLTPEENRPRFRRSGRAESLSATMSLSDQAWPCLCDWNGDGLIDLLIGGGYGWPRIVINRGTRERAAYAEPQPILSEGKPIRILMSEVYPGCEEYKHNMGYPFPVFVDWDGDGLPDLMLPNCSNRVFWYRNLGTRTEPKFGPRQQLDPVGWEDTPEKRLATGKILMSRWEGELEPGQPFFWRTGAAFADFNGDGLTDMVTHDGETRKATLFAQFRDDKGAVRLKKSDPLRLTDGRAIDDSLVGRTAHWTESFRAADWDGDGLIDLVYSCAGSTPKGSIYLLRNAGSKELPVFEPPRTLSCFGEPIYVTAHGPHPWVGDFDGDGAPDLVTGVEWSVYPFYRHAAIELTDRPGYTLSPVQSR
jgi:hypothetical protein